MAIPALEIPLINPLRFVPVDGEISRDPRDNMIHFDADWYVRYIRDWQVRSGYAQPWQFNDRMAVHYHAASTFLPELKLIDCSGKVWHTWSPSLYYTAAGIRIKVGESSVAANTFHIKFKFSDVVGLPEGIYLLHLVQQFDLDEDTVADYTRNNVSEPITVAANHYGTTHLDYYHSYNTQDVLFSQTNARFSLRLATDVVDYAPASVDTHYEDGANNAQILASTIYRTAKYVTTERVPEWMVDKLNRAWGCDHVSVDSVAFVKEPGAKWELSRTARTPKVAASLQIREGDNNAGARQVVAPTITLFTIPSYPYLITSLALDLPVGSYPFVLLPTLINDATEQTAFITAINAFATSEDFSGAFSVVGGDFIWTNAGSDLFLSGSATVLTGPLTYEVTGTVAEAIDFQNANAYIFWGDGNWEYVNGAGPVSSSQHTYGTPATYDIQVFGSYASIEFNDGYLTNLGGLLPSGLISFSLHNSFSITSIDGGIFANADSTIEAIAVYDCSALATIVSLGSSFPAINYVSFAADALSTAAVNSIIIAIYGAVTTYNILFGQLYVNAQLPSGAPPSGTAASNAADLALMYSWTVAHD